MPTPKFAFHLFYFFAAIDLLHSALSHDPSSCTNFSSYLQQNKTKASLTIITSIVIDNIMNLARPVSRCASARFNGQSEWSDQLTSSDPRSLVIFSRLASTAASSPSRPLRLLTCVSRARPGSARHYPLLLVQIYRAAGFLMIWSWSPSELRGPL